MCWIMKKEAKNPVPFDFIDEAQKRNKDGYGVSWIKNGVISTFKTLDYQEFIAHIRTIQDCLMVVHLRFTSAGTTCADNIHPFPVPTVHYSKSTLEADKTYFARTNLFGHSGDGIEVGIPTELPEAQLYTEFIKKKHEYRAIVVDDEVVDLKKKLKKRDFEGDRSPYVWNVANGYIFARNDIEFHPTLPQLAIDATKALNLSYGAVDIIQDRNGNLYVLEINTAFGLCGHTIPLVGEAIKKLINKRI